MTFTYDLASADADEVAISKVRLELGDTVSGTGVRPSNANLTDEEIAVWLEDEDDHIMRTVARACEALARMWSPMSNYSDGQQSEQFGKVAAEYAAKAKELRSLYGGSSGSAFAVGAGRSDGYADAAAEDS